MSDVHDDPKIMPLLRELFPYAIGVVADDNAPFFERVGRELPLTLHRYVSGSTYNGWVVPPLWRVTEATISRDGREVFDGRRHPLGVASYSNSFHGELDFDDLRPHLVTAPSQPEAYVYHCRWQIRPWDADWALSVPWATLRTFTPGRYRVDLETVAEPGEMLVAVHDHRGRSDRTIVFNAHTCHAWQANDDLAGVVVLIRLFQWLATQDTYYTYRLILAPEHLGTVFYLRDLDDPELRRLVGGAFAEMPGTAGPVKVATSFLGDQPIDQAFRNAARHHAKACEFVGWREGAGNDETVWEAPGYEVPFVEVSRSAGIESPFPEYHTSLDTPDLMDPAQLDEFYRVFQRAVEALEHDAVVHRRFQGLVCLSNPSYDLYLERPDPAVVKQVDETWGHLLDFLLRYFDGQTRVLDIAERHDLPFDRLRRYIGRFAERGIVRLVFAPIERRPISRPDPEWDGRPPGGGPPCSR